MGSYLKLRGDNAKNNAKSFCCPAGGLGSVQMISAKQAENAYKSNLLHICSFPNLVSYSCIYLSCRLFKSVNLV